MMEKVVIDNTNVVIAAKYKRVTKDIDTLYLRISFNEEWTEKENKFLFLSINEYMELTKFDQLILDLSNVKKIKHDLPYEKILKKQLERRKKLIVVQKNVEDFRAVVGVSGVKIFNDLDAAMHDLNMKEALSSWDEINKDISNIKIEAYSWIENNSNCLLGCLVRIIGEYGFGSDGAADAMYIFWKLREVCEYINPSFLVIDLSKFKYTWGNDLNLWPPGFMKNDSPIRIIVNGENYERLVNLVEEYQLCNNENEAINEARELCKNH